MVNRAPLRSLVIRSFLHSLAGLFAVWWLTGDGAAVAQAQTDRRFVDTPGLVLETGARHATCDVLMFTADGGTLLAAGDDKVVRCWPVVKGEGGASDRLDAKGARVLRWPMLREHRGSIYAVALSPDQGRVVVGGWGLINGLLAVINRGADRPANAGVIEHVTSDEVRQGKAVWSIAFAPSGKQVVCGTEDGGLHLWDFGAREAFTRRFTASGPPAGTTATTRNRVRLVHFLDRFRFLSVEEKGRVLEWDIRSLGAKPRSRHEFAVGRVFRAAISADGSRIAVSGEDHTAREQRTVAVVDLKAGRAWRVGIPLIPNREAVPRSVALDATGSRLAIGVRLFPEAGTMTFQKTIGGRVYVLPLPASAPGETISPKPSADLDLGYNPDAIAFRPGRANQFATAGGDNHEVRLWDLRNGNLSSTIRSPGSCLWGVAFSKDGRYLGFEDKRASNPVNPNKWGAGPWRVFDLEGQSILPAAPRTFAPILPLEAYGGWSVKFSRADGRLWTVVGPGGTAYPLDKKSGLYNPDANNLPRCYTFLPPLAEGKPVRLVVGHQFGASVYELGEGGVRLARVLVGHEDEVMALGRSTNGRTLVTASRDQTIACWSLDPMPTRSELGASFRLAGGVLTVERVDPGSPAWEAGLTAGDTIAVLYSLSGGFLYNPERRKVEAKPYSFFVPPGRVKVIDGGAALVALTTGTRPLRELVFVIKRADGTEKQTLTTLKHRPLWKFFPTRAAEGNNWVVWRSHDFYYHTRDGQADSLMGWHVNVGTGGARPKGELFLPASAVVTRKPEFYPLEHFRRKFHRPDKLRQLLVPGALQPERLVFGDLEPPEVTLGPKVPPLLTDEDLVVHIRVRPRRDLPGGPVGPRQRIDQVNVWVNDHRLDLALKPGADGGIDLPKQAIPQGVLRRGDNFVRVEAYNVEGGLGIDQIVVKFASKKRPAKAQLFALCVGIGRTYEKVGLDNLRCAPHDAEMVAAALQGHSDSLLYDKAQVTLLKEDEATPARIQKELRALGAKAGADDWLVLFIAGHGMNRGQGVGKAEFVYVCSDKKDSYLSSRQMSEALSASLAHKLIFVDACQSGTILEESPLRSLGRDGMHAVMFSACKANQSAIEPAEAKYGNHGFFTEALLGAIGGPAVGAKGRRTALHADEVEAELKRRVAAQIDRFTKLGVSDLDQTPQFFLPAGRRVGILCKP